MGNSFFKFKQFSINQDRCAMKVSTDACIHGAWTPIEDRVTRVLDIGTGTGLLSLMLAQRAHKIEIDAIEYDKEASKQAQENINDSPWSTRVSVINIDANQYDSTNKYDLIISNPPFYNDSLLGSSQSRNIARHTLTLSYKQLFDCIRRNITPDGYASILLPLPALDSWISIIEEHNWKMYRTLFIHPSESKSANRLVVLCALANNDTVEESLCIRTDGGYTKEYKDLLSPYYL